MTAFIPLALFFDSTGAGEWVVLFIVVLLVVGPKRLPEIARKLGKWMETFRRAADEFRRQLLTMDQEPEKEHGQTDVDGVESPDMEDDYSDPQDDSPYPGNEDKVKEWSSDDISDIPPDQDDSGEGYPGEGYPGEGYPGEDYSTDEDMGDRAEVESALSERSLSEMDALNDPSPDEAAGEGAGEKPFEQKSDGKE